MVDLADLRSKGTLRMQIDFLYFEDCPSHDKALARLHDVLAEEALTADINVHKMETEEQAAQWRFVGSPTIMVNGEDIVPTEQADYSLSCRVYQWDDGRFSPLPSPEMIRRGLHRHMQEES